MLLDETIKKQLGYMLVAIWAFIGLGFLDLIGVLSPLWIIALEGVWYAVDTFVLFYIHYIFKIVVTSTQPEEAIEPVTFHEAKKEEII